MTADRRSDLALDTGGPQGRVYIANLEADVTAEEVRMTCSQFGSVLHCRVGRAPGFDKQYAVVQFSSSLDAKRVIGLLSGNGWIVRRAQVSNSMGASRSASCQRGGADLHGTLQAGRQHRVCSREKPSPSQPGDTSASPLRVRFVPHTTQS